MIYNFSSWYKSKRVDEQMVIKVSGGESRKSSGGDQKKSNKTTTSSLDLSKVESFFTALPGVEKVETGAWGKDSKSCIFPYSGKKYQIFVWPTGFAVRNTENWQWSDYGSDSKKLALSVSDYGTWSGKFTNAANISQEFGNWNDFVEKLMQSQAAVASVQYGADDPARADQLVEEIVTKIDGVLKSDGFKQRFKGTKSGMDDVYGATKYLQDEWWKTSDVAQSVRNLRSEIDKLPPAEKGGNNRARLEKTYNLLNWEIGHANGGPNGSQTSYFGKCIQDKTNTFVFNYDGASGPLSRTFYTDF